MHLKVQWPCVSQRLDLGFRNQVEFTPERRQAVGLASECWLVSWQPSKQVVAGSSPVSRSTSSEDLASKNSQKFTKLTSEILTAFLDSRASGTSPCLVLPCLECNRPFVSTLRHGKQAYVEGLKSRRLSHLFDKPGQCAELLTLVGNFKYPSL